MKYQLKTPLKHLYLWANIPTLLPIIQYIERKMYKNIIATFILTGMALGTAHASAIDSLQAFNNDTNGISGSFTQTVQSKKKTNRSSGSFEILRPGYFKWNYNKPYQQSIIGDTKTVWLYDKDLAQVTKKNQKDAIGDSPAAILSDKTAISASYNLKEDGTENGIEYVLATPKNKNSGYQYIRIGFKGQSLTAMQLKDSFGNQTNIQFTNINMNPNLKPSNFNFTPPKGVDVLSQ